MFVIIEQTNEDTFQFIGCAADEAAVEQAKARPAFAGRDIRFYAAHLAIIHEPTTNYGWY